MKVCLCQLKIIWEDKEKNYRKAEEFIKKAVFYKAELICFPEMSFTGFSMNINKTKESNKETIEIMRKLAKRYNTNIAFGWVKSVEKKAENHYSIVNSGGEIILDYIKIHPFSYCGEDEYFNGGNEIKICSLNDINISSLICYDLRFPEIFQSVSKNASLIIVAANWPEKRSEHWKCLLKARAIENQVYILGVNCTGEINGLKYSGNSCFIDPLGNVIKCLSSKEGIIIYDIKDDVYKYREEFPIKEDRKIELYKRIL